MPHPVLALLASVAAATVGAAVVVTVAGVSAVFVLPAALGVGVVALVHDRRGDRV